MKRINKRKRWAPDIATEHKLLDFWREKKKQNPNVFNKGNNYLGMKKFTYHKSK